MRQLRKIWAQLLSVDSALAAWEHSVRHHAVQGAVGSARLLWTHDAGRTHQGHWLWLCMVRSMTQPAGMGTTAGPQQAACHHATDSASTAAPGHGTVLWSIAKSLGFASLVLAGCTSTATATHQSSNAPSPVSSPSSSPTTPASPSSAQAPAPVLQRTLVPLGPCCSQPYSFPTHQLKLPHQPSSQPSSNCPTGSLKSSSANNLANEPRGHHNQAAASSIQVEEHGSQQQPVVLVSCGSFNPPTSAHIHMCDVAVTALEQAEHRVLGVYLSPVGDGYGKPGLAPACDRVAMCEAASVTHPRIMCDRWEPCQPTGYTRTLAVLRHVTAEIEAWWGRTASQTQQTQLPQQNRAGIAPTGTASDPAGSTTQSADGQAGNVLQRQAGSGVRVMLLCGADVLESMQRPGVWRDPDVLLVEHGVVCVVRPGTDIAPLLESPGGLLNRFKDRIIVATDGSPSPLSSTIVRTALREGRPLDGMVPPGVASYLAAHQGLYRQ